MARSNYIPKRPLTWFRRMDVVTMDVLDELANRIRLRYPETVNEIDECLAPMEKNNG